MSIRKIKNAKDLSTNELIYFKSHAQATFMNNGLNVEEVITNLENSQNSAKEEILNNIAEKQDIILDLDIIREGAAKGATALQSIPSEYITETELANKGYVTTSDLDNKMDKVTLATVATSGNYNDLSNKPTIPSEQVNADWNATSGKAQILNKPTIPSAVTESTVSGWGFTKNTGTYSKPSTGIPKTDLASAVQTSLGKADTALQSYTEKYKGTVTGVKINGTTKNPSSGVVDLGTVITAHQDISGKQDKLVSGTNIKTINGTSILGSGNIVISGGGGSSSGSGAYSEVNHGTSDTTFTLTPNTFHVWDEVSALTLTLGSETAGVANEFLFQFTSGATATSLTLPDDIKWANDAAPVIAENMIYQVSILKGMASVLEFSNAVELIENLATISNGMMECTVTFTYPVASEVIVKVRSDDGPKTSTFAVGDKTKTIMLMGPSAAHIESIIPAIDTTYNYTW